MKKRVGILTGGGDAPGLNAVISAIIHKAEHLGWEVIGFKRGWAGIIDGDAVNLTIDDAKDLHREGGTLIFSSRTNPYKKEGALEKIKENFEKFALDGFIAIGGEDTLGVANRLHKDFNLPFVGVPKTIDNDLSATDTTFGFDTAINIIARALDDLHTTARSHQRVMVVEIMGRHAGWLALYGGIAGGAHYVIIPEVPFRLDELCDFLETRKKRGEVYSIVAVAEGARLAEGEVLQDQELDEFGHVRLGGIAKTLEKEIKSRTSLEVRHVVLGHLQRGGRPTAFDRMLGIRYGMKAMDLVAEGKFGYMSALHGNQIVGVKLEDAVSVLKTVPVEKYEEFKIFFR